MNTMSGASFRMDWIGASVVYAERQKKGSTAMGWAE